MFCSVPKQFMFLHAPKTGGSTFSHLLRQAFASAGDHNKPRRGPRQMHLPVEHFKQMIEVNKHMKFHTIARNPWDRLVSMYYFFFARESNSNMTDADNIAAFRKWVRETIKPHKYVDVPAMTDRNVATSFIDTVNPVNGPKSIWSYITIDGECVVSDYIRFEHLERDICDFFEAYQLTKPVDIPRHARSSRPDIPVWDMYDQECVDIVGDIFSSDVSHFGYKFGN